MSQRTRSSKPLFLAPPSLTSDSDASISASETAPITPINRSFPEHDQDPTLVTAVTSATSENVIAARARARSDAAAMTNRPPFLPSSKPGADYLDDSSPLSAIVGGSMPWRRDLAPDESPAAARRVRLSSSAGEDSRPASYEAQQGSTLHLEQARTALDASLARGPTGRTPTPTHERLSTSQSLAASDASSSPLGPFGHPGRVRAASMVLPTPSSFNRESSVGSSSHFMRAHQQHHGSGPGNLGATVSGGASLSPLRHSVLSRNYSPGQSSSSDGTSPSHLSGSTGIFDQAAAHDGSRPAVRRSPSQDAHRHGHDFDSSLNTIPSLASDSSLGSSGLIDTPDTTANTAFSAKSPAVLRHSAVLDSPWFRHRQETFSARGAPDSPSPKAFSFPRSTDEEQRMEQKEEQRRILELRDASNSAARPLSADANRPKAFSIAGNRPPRIQLAPSENLEQDIFGPIAAPSPHSSAGATSLRHEGPGEATPIHGGGPLLFQDATIGSQSSPATRAPSANSLLRRQTIGAYEATQRRPASAHLLGPSPQHSPTPAVRSPLAGPPLAPQTDSSDPVLVEGGDAQAEKSPSGQCHRGLITFPASESVDMDTIGAALEVDSYKPRSPSQMESSGPIITSACELCGAFAEKLTLLKPCGHRACAACCCSGLNQVSATPPRPHLCAACGLGVDEICLPQSRLRHSSLLSRARFITPGSFADIENKLPPDADAEEIPDLDLIDLHLTDHAPEQSSPVAPKPASFRPGSAEAARASAETVVVRIDNIPWTAGLHEILAWVPDHAEILPDPSAVAHPIHVPIELTSGKTGNSGFVECRDRAAAHKLIRHRNNSRLCGRPVNTLMASREELLAEIFPSRSLSRSTDPRECTFFTPRELAELMTLLKSGSPQLKGPLKVVEYATSMIRLVPRELEHGQRDLLFERTIEIVRLCIAAIGDIRGLRASLDRLLLQVGLCGAFTVTQKLRIFDDARHTLETVRLYSEAVDTLIEQHHRHETEGVTIQAAHPSDGAKQGLHTDRPEISRPRAHTTIGSGHRARANFGSDFAPEQTQGQFEESAAFEPQPSLPSAATPVTPPQPGFYIPSLSPLPNPQLTTPQLQHLAASVPSHSFSSPSPYASLGAFAPSPYPSYVPTCSPWQGVAGVAPALGQDLTGYQQPFPPNFSTFHGHHQQQELASSLPPTSMQDLPMATNFGQNPWYGRSTPSSQQRIQAPASSMGGHSSYQQQSDTGEFRALVHAVAASLMHQQQGHQHPQAQAQQHHFQPHPPQ